MAIPDALKKKMLKAQGSLPQGSSEDESESASDASASVGMSGASGASTGESASDIDAATMKGGKPNPLKQWASKKMASG